MILENAEIPPAGSVTLNTDIWNNKRIAQLSGYTIEMLKEPLCHLSEFIKANLVPNKLEYFALGDILGVSNIKTHCCE